DRKHHDGDDDDGRAATSKRGDDEGRGGEADEAKKDEAKGEAKDEARAPAGDAAGEHAVGGVAVGGGEAGGAVAKSDARRDGGADKADAKAKRSKKTKAEADKAVLASLKTDGAAIDDRDTRSGKSISDETPALATTHGMSVVMPPAAAAAAAPAPAADGAAKPADARPVKVKLSKADIKGALSTDEVTAMKKKLRGGLKSCYRDALDSGASESATATVVVIISESGAVKSVELRGSTLDHTAGEACMKAKLGALTYPAAAGGGSTTVTYSAEFSASADAGATATE
ncbi:MAG TPA: AgmX/PglI C-terminal domain-containing protein, partial [Myxococcota bacterium]|nr:AgmX/PglI C-terminal domain-containing protein [Myxococcota bacterium]